MGWTPSWDLNMLHPLTTMSSVLYTKPTNFKRSRRRNSAIAGIMLKKNSDKTTDKSEKATLATHLLVSTLGKLFSLVVSQAERRKKISQTQVLIHSAIPFFLFLFFAQLLLGMAVRLCLSLSLGSLTCSLPGYPVIWINVPKENNDCPKRVIVPIAKKKPTHQHSTTEMT